MSWREIREIIFFNDFHIPERENLPTGLQIADVIAAAETFDQMVAYSRSYAWLMTAVVEDRLVVTCDVPRNQFVFMVPGALVNSAFREQTVGRATKKRAPYFTAINQNNSMGLSERVYFSTWNVGLVRLENICKAPAGDRRINSYVEIMDNAPAGADVQRNKLFTLVTLQALPKGAVIVIESSWDDVCNIDIDVDYPTSDHQAASTSHGATAVVGQIVSENIYKLSFLLQS